MFTLSGYSVKAVSVFKDKGTYDSKRPVGLFRLDVYNSEIAKSANLQDVRSDLKNDYLVILDLGVSKMNWARAIDLRVNETIFISNYKSGLGEGIEPVISYFISSMMGE